MSGHSVLAQARRETVVFALLLVTTVAVNVAQFGPIEERTSGRYQALNRSETADVTIIGHDESGAFRHRYGLYLALAEIAPGSRVWAPAASPYADSEIRARLLSFGQAAHVDVASVAADLETADLEAADLEAADLEGVWSGYGEGDAPDLTPLIVARGAGDERFSPWAIAVAQRPRPQVAPDDFLPEALRDGRGRSPGPPRELLLLRWNHARPGSPHHHHDLLLETSLLPHTIRTELTR